MINLILLSLDTSQILSFILPFLKRIDDMEMYPDECIKTNIQGSENVAKAALKNNIKKMQLISRIKHTKLLIVTGSSITAERVFTNYDYSSSKTVFASVRYGVYFCSRGSFIPLWLELIKINKNTVTSMDMTRFLFTIQDAVDTVLNAVEWQGEVFIPQINSFGMETIIQALENMTQETIN